MESCSKLISKTETYKLSKLDFYQPSARITRQNIYPSVREFFNGIGEDHALRPESCKRKTDEGEPCLCDANVV